MLHQINDGATRLFIQSSCLLVALPDATRIKRCISYMVVLSTRLNQPFKYFALFPFFDAAI